ncbi:MAG: ABC transporter permease, partial [Promethearchaeota archaeon]
PPVVVVLGFLLAFGPEGIINNFWKEVSGTNKPIINIYKTFWGIIFAHTFYNASVFIRVVGTGWEQLNPEFEEVSTTLGSSDQRTFFRITFPRLWPSLLAASVIVFLYCFTSFTIVFAIGGIKYQTLETRIYTTARAYLIEDRINLAAALALIQLIVCILLSWIYARESELMRGEKVGYSTTQLKNTLFSNPLISYQRKITIFSYFVVLCGVILLPMFAVFAFSLFTKDGNFSFQVYLDILSEKHNPFLRTSPRSQIINSLIFSILTMIGATLLGLIAAYALNSLTEYKSLRITIRRFLIIFVLIPMAASNITFALGLFRTFKDTIIWKENIWMIIVLAHILVAFPFANRSINASLESQNPEYRQIAATLGASRIRTLLKIELPLILPSIIAAATFSFAISMGEFGATYFLSSPEYSTISVGIYRFLDMRQMQSAASMAVLLIIVCTISFLIVEKLGRVERILG